MEYQADWIRIEQPRIDDEAQVPVRQAQDEEQVPKRWRWPTFGLGWMARALVQMHYNSYMRY